MHSDVPIILREAKSGRDVNFGFTIGSALGFAQANRTPLSNCTSSVRRLSVMQMQKLNCLFPALSRDAQDDRHGHANASLQSFLLQT